jgi:hypothetical protein
VLHHRLQRKGVLEGAEDCSFADTMRIEFAQRASRRPANFMGGNPARRI